MKKGQKQPTSHSCTDLNKTQFFPVSIVKNQSEGDSDVLH